jgi:hypothetical protein
LPTGDLNGFLIPAVVENPRIVALFKNLALGGGHKSETLALVNKLEKVT